MTAYAHIKKCFELSDEDIMGAIESREDTLALLKRLEAIAKPDTGAAKALVVFARMGSTACEWVEGDLRVDIRMDPRGDDECTIDVTSELGMGMRERIFPTLVFGVLLEEFRRAIERVPDRIRPLRLTAQTPRLLTFTVTERMRQTSVPPPPIKIAEDSFFQLASLKPAKAPLIEGRAPALPVVTPQLPIVSEAHRSSAHVRIAKKVSSRPPKKKSVAPPKKATVPPKKKSIGPPPKPKLDRPPLPRPKPREEASKPEPKMPPLPIVEPGLPIVNAARGKSKAPPRKHSKPRLSLEDRIGDIQDEDVDSGWGENDD